MPEVMEPEERRQQAEVIDFLRGLSRDSGEGGEEIVTPTSRIFLAGDSAYKLKRARRLPFLDFTDPLTRRKTAEHEDLLNRRTAPRLYQGVLAVTRDDNGALHLGGPGAPVDWIVHMRRFGQEMQGDRLAARGQFTPLHAARLGDAIAEFHRDLAPWFDHGGADALRRSLEPVVEALSHAPSPAIVEWGAALATQLFDQIERHRALLDRRRDAGFVRHCHGDLHLGNIAIVNDEPRPFDCIEFDDELAIVDMLYDAAFPVMDLLRYGLREAASVLVNRYLAAMGDYEGTPLLPLYIGARALIRTMSEGLNAREEAALAYLEVARQALQPTRPRLVAVGGLSGSGKSSVARALAPGLDAAPGAILLRSDEIRKRLHGVAPEDNLSEDAYRPAVTKQVFARMHEQARAVLNSGRSVILDATHMDPGQRQAVERLAADCGVPFAGLWFAAPPEVLIARVAKRSGDASDADAEVVRRQLKADLGDIQWRHIDAARPLDAVVAESRACLVRSS